MQVSVLCISVYDLLVARFYQDYHAAFLWQASRKITEFSALKQKPEGVTGCSAQPSPMTCFCSSERNASLYVSFCLLFLLWYLNHVLPPRDAKDEVLRPSHHHAQGAAGGEPLPPLERPEPRRSSGVVRFALDVNQTE